MSPEDSEHSHSQLSWGSHDRNTVNGTIMDARGHTQYYIYNYYLQYFIYNSHFCAIPIGIILDNLLLLKYFV